MENINKGLLHRAFSVFIFHLQIVNYYHDNAHRREDAVSRYADEYILFFPLDDFEDEKVEENRFTSLPFCIAFRTLIILQ